MNDFPSKNSASRGARIAVIAPSMAPMLGGIADYSERLGRELRARGHEILLLGVNEFHEGAPVGWCERGGLRVLNISAFLPWAEKRDAIRRALAEFRPEAIALQYHWHGFWSRRSHTSLVRTLSELSRQCRRHIMYHETWESTHASARLPQWLHRARIIAQLATMHHVFRPHVAWTNTGHHAGQLGWLGARCAVHPIPSSIPVCEVSAVLSEETWGQMLSFSEKKIRREETWCAVLFGRIPPNWSAAEAFPWLKRLFAASGRAHGCVISVGNIGYQERGWRQLCEVMGREFTCIKLGLQPPETVSRVLSLSDLGVVSTSAALLDKSSTAAAMREHGLPILVTDVRSLAREFSAENVIFAGADFEAQAALSGRRAPEVSVWSRLAAAYEVDLLGSKIRSDAPFS